MFVCLWIKQSDKLILVFVWSACCCCCCCRICGVYYIIKRFVLFVQSAKSQINAKCPLKREKISCLLAVICKVTRLRLASSSSHHEPSLVFKCLLFTMKPDGFCECPKKSIYFESRYHTHTHTHTKVIKLKLVYMIARTQNDPCVCMCERPYALSISYYTKPGFFSFFIYIYSECSHKKIWYLLV